MEQCAVGAPRHTEHYIAMASGLQRWLDFGPKSGLTVEQTVKKLMENAGFVCWQENPVCWAKL